MGTLSPSPWDLSLSGQNRAARAAAPPRHSGTRVGAPVASLRCRILRRGDAQYKSSCPTARLPCRTRRRHGITTPVLAQFLWPVLK